MAGLIVFLVQDLNRALLLATVSVQIKIHVCFAKRKISYSSKCLFILAHL